MSELIEETDFREGEDFDPGPEEEPGTDVEAPYGRKADGTPKKRPGRQPGSGGGTSTGGRKAKFERSVIADKITEYLAVPVSVASPLAASVIDDRSERVADSLIILAGKSPRFAKGLANFLKGSAYAELIMFPMAIVIAFMVDYQRISPYSFPAKQFKIDEFYEMLMAEAGKDPAEFAGGRTAPAESRSGLVA